MVQTEGWIEGGIAEPGALGVEEYGPARADDNVLRADVAMDERNMGRKGLPREGKE